ncbi:hypothetical protein BGZ58_010716 [Dissophora ornata]|nr:hypothetical protein BGZ58_010716 [Dissophora ornata]
MTTPPQLPKRRPASAGMAEDVEPFIVSSRPSTEPPKDLAPPPLPKRQQPDVIITPPTKSNTLGQEFSLPTAQSAASPGNALPGQLRPEPIGISSPGLTTTIGRSAQAAQSAKSKEELSFQFDRHVQEIRRRRTTAKKAPPPDRDEFTRVEVESGKRVLDVGLFAQAHLMYFVESLARDDNVKKVEPLKWTKIKALLSRLYDTSNPVQSLGLYIDRVMHWRNPPETFAWFSLYFMLWFYKLWLPGLISLFVIKMLNNRFGVLGDVHERFNVPGSLNDNLQQTDPKRKTKLHSQLRELIHSKDLTDWVSQMIKIWGPYCQALLEENVCYLERVKNLFRWERPEQTWRIIALLCFYIFVSTFFQYMVVPAIGWFIGVEFFFLLPLQERYPRFSHVFSPVEWILWSVPTNAELAVELLTRQQEEMHQLSDGNDGGVADALEPVTNGEERDTASFISGLSPASKIKYEYQKRMQGRSGSITMSVPSQLADSVQEKTEFHCLLRGKPGRLIITEEALQFRSPKLLGRDTEVQIRWENIDTIKKSKTMNLGIWSMPGIDVTDINGQVTVFQNVVHRDDAFRKLVVTSGKKWSNVS